MGTKVYPVTVNGVYIEVRAASKEEAQEKAKEVDLSSAPKLIAREGTTRVFERQNGQRYVVSPGVSFTDPEKVEKALSGMTAGEISRQSIDESLIAESPVGARAGEFLRGVPFAGSRLDEALGPERGAGARMLSGAMQRQRPGETLGLNLAGGITAAGTAALAAPAAAVTAPVVNFLSKGPRLAKTAKAALVGSGLGAVEGGVYGSGEGTTPEERAVEARRGAGIGAVSGGVFGAASPVASDVIKNITSLFRRSDVRQIAKEFGISSNAAKVIKNTFEQGGDIETAVANLKRAGNEAMIVDAGPAAQALLDATAASGGAAGQVAREAVGQRMSRTNEAVSGALEEALGPVPIGPNAALREISRRSAPARDEAYRLAYSTPIDYSSEQGIKVEEVLSRIDPETVMKAIREANNEMRSLGIRNNQIMASITPDGEVVYTEMPNVMQLDELKKALQKTAYSNENTNKFGKLTGTGQRLNRLSGELRDAVSEAVEPYGTAVSIGGDKIAEENAFMLGRNLLKTGTEVEDVAIELGANPSTDQVAAAKSGLRSYIEKALGDVRAIASDPTVEALEARQVIKAVTDMSSENARKKIRGLMGAETDALLAQIDEAAQSAAVRAAMAQNSKTASRLAVSGAIEEVTKPGVLGKAMQGEAVGTTKSLIQAVTGQTSEYTEGVRQKIYQDIARALTEKSGENALTALRVLDGAMKGQSLTDKQTEQLAKMISGVLFSAATTGTARGAAAERRQAQ
jgi:hypothetical protein